MSFESRPDSNLLTVSFLDVSFFSANLFLCDRWSFMFLVMLELILILKWIIVEQFRWEL